MFRLLAELERRAAITSGDGHDESAPGLTWCSRGCAMGDENDPQALILARVLLGGFLKEDKRGLHQKEYLKKNSGDEREARATLASILRNQGPLDRDLRGMLAALFDPKPGTHPVVERKIVFAHRTKGRRKKHEANTAISMARLGRGQERSHPDSSHRVCGRPLPFGRNHREKAVGEISSYFRKDMGAAEVG